MEKSWENIKRELVTIQLAHMYATVHTEKFLEKMVTHVSPIIVRCKIFRVVFILEPLLRLMFWDLIDLIGHRPWGFKETCPFPSNENAFEVPSSVRQY